MDGATKELTNIGATAAEKSRLPSRNTWKDIIHEGNLGTRIFPQAFLASGIRLARAFPRAANREGLPLAAFLTSDPPKYLTAKVIEAERDRAHGAYDIVSGNISSPNSFVNVWEQDRNKASDIIRNAAEIVSGVYPGGGSQEDLTLLSSLQTDPRFLTLLDANFKGLLSDKVIDISHIYKRQLIAFAHKYAPYIGKATYPQEYLHEQNELQSTLNEHITSVATLIRGTVQQQMGHAFPQENAIHESLARATNEELFGRVAVATVDPLGIFRNEW